MIFAAREVSQGGQLPAQLEASARFSLDVPEPGVIRWQLRAGVGPEGPVLVSLDERLTDRGDQVQVMMDPGLRSGNTVVRDQALVRLTSARQQQQLADLRGQLASLEARRDFLAAGSREQEVTAAQQAVRVARARLRSAQVEQDRTLRLSEQGAGSDAARQQAELEVQIQRASLRLAEARVAVAEAPARPEAIAEAEAARSGLAEQLAVLEDALGDTIHSPLSGTLELRSAPGVLEVLSTDPLLVRFPVAQQQRASLKEGDPIRFYASGFGRTAVEGSVAAISTHARLHGGKTVFWVSATLSNPSGALLPGMSGTVRLPGTGLGGWL